VTTECEARFLLLDDAGGVIAGWTDAGRGAREGPALASGTCKLAENGSIGNDQRSKIEGLVSVRREKDVVTK
jgi:hypothetical protein